MRLAKLLRSQWGRRILRVTSGLAIGLLLAEALLRIAGLASPSPYEPDLVCGARLKPHYAGWHRTEGRVFFRTNSAGFRDRERSIEKPRGGVSGAGYGGRSPGHRNAHDWPSSAVTSTSTPR